MTTVTQTKTYTATCGQCKFFDTDRGLCEGRLVPWEMDRSIPVRPFANPDDVACSDRYVEALPF